MKLLRYGPPGLEKPAMLDASGVIRDLSAHVPDLGPDQISPAGLRRIAALNMEDLPAITGQVRHGVPIAGTRKFVAIGLNYADHAAESNVPAPDEPVVFSKWITCLQGADDTVVLPKDSKKSDWEAELGVVIGTLARSVPQDSALDHVAGYCVVNDVSEREYQSERGGTWDKGKGFDTFGPVGPWLVTADEVGDPQTLAVWMELNGVRMQNGHTKNMIFSVAHLISYCSMLMTLEPGDIITTGTPAGVGAGRKPPVFLKHGDTMRVGIEKLGVQQQNVVARGQDRAAP